MTLFTGDNRYAESSRSSGGWHAGPPTVKSFNSVPSSGPRDPRNEISGWSSRSSENVNRYTIEWPLSPFLCFVKSIGRWAEDLYSNFYLSVIPTVKTIYVNRWSSSGTISNSIRHPGPPLYQGGGPMPSMSLAPPGTGPSYERFDPYKSSMPSMRKY